MTARPTVAEARLRAKSQLTLPEAIVAASHAAVGDRFIVEVAPEDPDTISLRRVRSSYAGVMAEVYGDATDALEEERASWERRGAR